LQKGRSTVDKEDGVIWTNKSNLWTIILWKSGRCESGKHGFILIGDRYLL